MILAGHTIVSGACTDTVAVVDGPTHPLAVGIMVKVVVCRLVVVLVNVPLTFPEPAAAIPVILTVLVLVHA